MTLQSPGGTFNLTTGPSQSQVAAVIAMAQPIESHYDPGFTDRYKVVMDLLRQAFDTDKEPLILHGECVLAIEAAAASVLDDSSVLLNLVSGPYGSAYSTWAERYAGEVVTLRVPYDEVIRPEQVREALKARPDITAVSAVHCETPCGTVDPLGEIGPVIREHGALFLIDAVSSFAGQEVSPEAWNADVLVGGPQKCLGGPPGLSLVYVSDRAWDRMESNPKAPRGSYMSMVDWRKIDVGTDFPFTPFVSCVYSLEGSLRTYLDRGPKNVWEEHARVARATREGAKAMGLSLFAKDESTCSSTVTALKVPDGVNPHAIIDWVRENYGVMMVPSTGEMKGKTFRFGHMGTSASPMYAALNITALGIGLRAHGAKVDVGAGIEAVVDSLAEGHAPPAT
ncbi:MAG: alanine--glyoxylate aminotransferase family protein [Acidimicrobiales bacterium]